MRRAALCGLLVGLKAWQYCATSTVLSTSAANKRLNNSGGDGILDSLRNVSRGSDLFFDDEGGGGEFGEEGGLTFDDARVARETSVKIALLSDPLISDVVDWVMNTVTDEQDLASKVLKQELLEQAIA